MREGLGVGSPEGADCPPPTPPACGRGDFTELTTTLAGQTALLLGWRPDDFWQATPAELASVIAAVSSDTDAVDTQTLSNLMELFPDG
jgi:hypothetical protein